MYRQVSINIALALINKYINTQKQNIVDGKRKDYFITF